MDLAEEALKGYPVDEPIERQTRCVRQVVLSSTG
jgi:hypothetical protein